MKLKKPIAQLIKKTFLDEPNQYYLHAVTYFDKTNVVADGHDPITPHILDDDGKFCVVLKVRTDEDLPEFNLLTPVSHTVELGPLPVDEETGLIRIIVKGSTKDPDDVGESTASPSDSQEDEKPIYS